MHICVSPGIDWGPGPVIESHSFAKASLTTDAERRLLFVLVAAALLAEPADCGTVIPIGFASAHPRQ